MVLFYGLVLTINYTSILVFDKNASDMNLVTCCM